MTRDTLICTCVFMIVGFIPLYPMIKYWIKNFKKNNKNFKK
jgi:hypothetical protein